MDMGFRLAVPAVEGPALVVAQLDASSKTTIPARAGRKEAGRMFKTRIALLGALALIVASGVFASQASAAGPYWHVNGTKLTQGTRQLKLQIKGVFIQKANIGGSSLTAECHTSLAEGAAIEGNGSSQGQDKGRLIFSQCKLSVPECKIVDPLTTAQTKSHLVTVKNAQTKYADLFEPAQGTTFLTYTISGCPLLAGKYSVAGSVAAFVPTEIEGQEGLINFPEAPISLVTLEQEEKKVGLRLGAEEYKIAGTYGARLDNGEKFGIFGQ
jgi:hypothetical protein